jgi:nucleoside-diphosphate-sugar epimerase
VITEDSPVSPDTASGQAHVHMEQYLRQVAPTTSSILRPAGLVGADRHPIRTLSGRSLTAPNKAVNLVFGEDVVSAIMALLATGPVSSPLHLCSNSHPQRKAYYEWAAKQLGIEKPSFTLDDDNLPTTGKRIDATHTWAKLGITPKFGNPYDMVVTGANRD